MDKAVLMVGVLAAGVGLAGCGGSTEGEARPSSASTSATTASGLAVDVPQSYNPCTDVPESVLKSERLVKGVADNKANADGPNGTKWRGCRWVAGGSGYSVAIQASNLTIPYVREHYTNGVQELTVAGRPAIATRRNETRPSEVCNVNVEIKGGSLEFQLDNPRSNRDTGHIDTCQLGLALAEKVVPTLPAGA
ncbi:DUF3558 domain-containing protein [Nocardia sp. NPDC004654]|uniref:DUF3558 domain-containing protein n=1 Tax=Nocardia sp. NPDC004654 TaxID=3154776 RepID=UPI0033BB5F8D